MNGAERPGTGDRCAIHPDAVSVCTLCSCLCHDVDPLATDAGFAACSIVRDFRRRFDGRDPFARKVDEADIATAGKLFAEAVRHGRSIVFVGLESVSWEVQKAAIDLAETVCAWVVRESEFSGVTSGWQEAFAQKGGQTATWSEIRQRSDALLLWYAPLWESHPRWIERFGPRSPRAHRLAVVAPDTPAPPEGWIEDQFVRVDPGRACEFSRAVRAALRDENAESADGNVRRIVHLFRNAHWLAIVRGGESAGLADSCGVAETMTDLIAEAQCEGVRRVVLTHVPDAPGAAGLDAILSMRAGLSTPMKFTPEGPMRGQGEWSPALAECVVSFGPGLAESPLPYGVRLVPDTGPGVSVSAGSAGLVVSIPVGRFGVDMPGTLIRADGVVVPARGVRGGGSIDLVEFLRSLRRDALRLIAPVSDRQEAGR